MGIIALVWIINFGISIWNARVVGLMWAESIHYGGWTRIMAWMGAIMSAAGFTWCYSVIAGYIAYKIEYLTLEEVEVFFSLGYLLITPFVLTSGLLIWIDSLIQAWKRRDFVSGATAAWNTFAQIHNTYSAMKGIPTAFGKVEGFFGSKSKDSKVFIATLVIVVAILGILTTTAIVMKYAGSRKLPQPSTNV